jgi:hypothetical protein
MTNASHADRLRKTLALKIKLRNAFTSPGLIEDNERQIRIAQKRSVPQRRQNCEYLPWAPVDRQCSR